MTTPPPPPATATAPAWISQPSPTQIARAEALYAQGLQGGHAVMKCAATADGRLSGCSADTQTSKAGLAEAVMSLESAYRLDLSAGPPAPTLFVSLDFPKVADAGPRLIAQPSAAEVAAASPSGVKGEVGLQCGVSSIGAVEACAVAADPSHDARLDHAALSLATEYRFAPASLDGKSVATFATIQISLGDPYRAFAAALRSGRALVQCRVGIDGKLSACKLINEFPKNSTFGAAALKAATRYRIKPPIVEGRPVEARITIPISWKMSANPATLFDSHLINRAPWIRVPTAEMVTAVYPKRELASGQSGLATMQCAFRQDGGLRDCVSTTPAAQASFAAAGLSLASRFQIDAAGAEPEALERIRIVINVAFSAGALASTAERYLSDPDWDAAADETVMRAAYPEAAKKAGVTSGGATVDCRIATTGDLEKCATTSEDPAGWSFAHAALQVARLMQANLWTRAGEPSAGQRVRLPLRFTAPPAAAPQAAAQ